MQNFGLQFTNPWFLLLLVPAAFFTFFPYFRLAKRYRRTRNRICSLVLHSLIMIMAISLLAGTTFVYSIPNKNNEIILLVDMSDSEEYSQKTRDDFVESVINEASYDNFKIGVVTFGYNQVYAVPLTDNTDSVFARYEKAEKPDTTATNIAAALNYAKDLFTNPESAKIVLVSDGRETDEAGAKVIRSVASKGIKVDTACIPSDFNHTDSLISSVELPDSYLEAGAEVNLSVTVKTKLRAISEDLTDSKPEVTLTLYDNGVADTANALDVTLAEGSRTLTLKHKFSETTSENNGFHEIKVTLTSSNDKLNVNNTYITYTIIENHNKVLILESETDQSKLIEELLDTDEFKVKDEDGNLKSTIKTINIINESNESYFPKTVDDLRAYDQVILNNVTYSDMPEGFEELLYSYVYDYGGGLFTVGGDDKTDKAHGYNREDMAKSKYLKQLLPVELINYTPPVGLFIIVDRSGSMSGTDDGNRKYIELAKAGALACVNVLTDRDYIGLMTLDSYAATILPLTPRTHENEILEAFDKLGDTSGGTVYKDALDDAGYALRTLSQVEKRHIMIVTDGQPGEDAAEYESIIKKYHDIDKTTFSVVVIGQSRPADADELDKIPVEEIDRIPTSSAYGKCLRMTKLGGGKLHWVSNADTDSLTYEMREDINMKEIRESEPKTFNPVANDSLSPLFTDIKLDLGNKFTKTLDGFYGVKVKKNADLLVVGEYTVPIYAQWKYGKGTVGSFMCDLNGKWSNDFLSKVNAEGEEDDSGRRLITNIIKNLMPTTDIRPKDIRIDINEDNYTNKMSVYTDVADGDVVTGTIVKVDENGSPDSEFKPVALEKTSNSGSVYVLLALDKTNNFSRCNFVVKESGVYKITVTKTSANGAKEDVVAYKTFSYSEEYDMTETDVDFKQTFTDLSKNSNGSAVEDLKDLSSIFESFVTRLSRTFDPRWLFAILAIVFFLLDIAVRKFKFKWPHELIAEFKKKKEKE